MNYPQLKESLENTKPAKERLQLANNKHVISKLLAIHRQLIGGLFTTLKTGYEANRDLILNPARALSSTYRPDAVTKALAPSDYQKDLEAMNGNKSGQLSLCESDEERYNGGLSINNESYQGGLSTFEK